MSISTDALIDAKRELDKAGEALNACALHFEHQGKADAALHLAVVNYNPLAAKTFGAAEACRQASDRLGRTISEMDEDGHQHEDKLREGW